LKVHIIDAHALLALSDTVRSDNHGEVFKAMNVMIRDRSLCVTRTVLEVLRQRDPNGGAGIWADAIVDSRGYTPVTFDLQQDVQAAAQKAGYEDGLEDTTAPQLTGAVEIAGLALLRDRVGHRPVVVTEDWIDKPLRPALASFCKHMGWSTSPLGEFLQNQALGHCLI
jgi:hypothetical protein